MPRSVQQRRLGQALALLLLRLVRLLLAPVLMPVLQHAQRECQIANGAGLFRVGLHGFPCGGQFRERNGVPAMPGDPVPPSEVGAFTKFMMRLPRRRMWWQGETDQHQLTALGKEVSIAICRALVRKHADLQES